MPRKKLTNLSTIPLRTRLKEQLQKAAESATMTKALIDSIGEGLIIVNEYGYVNQVNRPALEILGLEKDKLEGRWFSSAVQIYSKNGGTVADYDRPIIAALMSGKSVSQTVCFKIPGGDMVPVAVTASPFLIRGKPRGAVVIFRDISREAKLEHAKDEFVSIASHQLRSPLTSVKLFAELLADSSKAKLSAKELGYIDKIRLSTDKMIDLVTDFLNVSRIELGNLRINPQPTDISDLIKDVIDEITPVAAASGLKLNFTDQTAAKSTVLIDGGLFRQVIHNLISNAIRYGRPKSGRGGNIHVTLNCARNRCKITVADKGIGIPSTGRAKIFERFYRAENAAKLESEGTGLGLYLAKQITEAFGGRISYQSRENTGTTFYISIPVAKAETA